MQHESNPLLGHAASLAIKKEMADSKLKGNKMTTQTLAAHWILATMTLSETIEGTRKEIGSVKVPVPTLQAFGITAEREIDEETKQPATDDYGCPMFKQKEHDFLQDAIRNAVFTKARNAFVPKTIELKEGKALATDFDTLTADSERSGEHLKIRAEAVKAFKGFLVSVGVKEAVAETMARMFRDKESLASQSDTVKGKMKARIAAFLESLSAENMTRYSKTIITADEACATAAVDPNEM